MRLHGDPGRSASLGLSPSPLTSAPSSSGLAAPRHGSHAPRAGRAPGPTERSSRPPISRPPARPRRGGGAGGGAQRRGREGDGDALGARGAGRAGDHPGPPSPRLRALSPRPPCKQPLVNPARIYTPLPPRRSPRRVSGDLALQSAPSLPTPFSPELLCSVQTSKKLRFFFGLDCVLERERSEMPFQEPHFQTPRDRRPFAAVDCRG